MFTHGNRKLIFRILGITSVLLLFHFLIIGKLMRSNQIGILKSFDPHRKNDSHNLPSETGQILDEVATVKLDLVFIVTIDTASEMDALRRLVGSIHLHRANNLDVPLIKIFGLRLGSREQDEIGLWRNIEYFDAVDTLHQIQPSLTNPEKSLTDSLLLLTLLQVNLRMHNHVIYVRSHVSFTAETLHELYYKLEGHDAVFTDTQVEQYWHQPVIALRHGSKAASILIDFELQCRRRFHCSEMFWQALKESQHRILKGSSTLQVTDADDRYFCHILLRDDILYSIDGNERSLAKQDGKIHVAIGMLTMSTEQVETWQDSSPVKTFLPHFITSITETERHQYVYHVYIGYDSGDRYFDNQRTLPSIQEYFEQMLSYAGIENEIHFLKFPYTGGWVTFLWNALFVQAMHYGCDYFYQVNDDLEIASSGWTTFFVQSFKENNEFGIAAPYDAGHKGRVFTQAFVSRKHYEIFGRLYPMDIKDWYSDNWITNVYPEPARYVSETHQTRNLNNYGTRYKGCNTPRYDVVLQRGQATLAHWLRNKELELGGVRGKENLFQRELDFGALIQ